MTSKVEQVLADCADLDVAIACLADVPEEADRVGIAQVSAKCLEHSVLPRGSPRLPPCSRGSYWRMDGRTNSVRKEAVEDVLMFVARISVAGRRHAMET